MTGRDIKIAAEFFDFISSIVTTFEGDNIEDCYGSVEKPKCLSDLLKMIFDSGADSKYCWLTGDDAERNNTTFDARHDAKKNSVYTYYNVTADPAQCLLDFYKMIPMATNGHKIWKPVSTGTYTDWMKSLFTGIVEAAGGQRRPDEFNVPWLNFKYNGTFCTFTFKQSGVDIDMGRVYQLYTDGGDREKVFKDIQADVSMSFPDGVDPVFGLGVCEEFRATTSIVNNYTKPIMILNNFIMVPRQLVARLGFRKIHTLTI